MTTLFRSKIVKIGNSRGIRIPQVLLEQAGLTDEVEMIVEGKDLIIHPAHSSRGGWEAQFSAMSTNNDDKMLDQNAPTQWDQDEWEW